MIEPLIHGGKSTTVFRSGTPATPLIVSMAKALRLAYDHFSDKTKHVQEIHDYLLEKLSSLPVFINSNSNCIPHVINISLDHIKSEVMLHALEKDEIYVSTQTACSTSQYSKAVYALTHDENRSSRSMRISISYLTTKKEIDTFIQVFEKNLKELNMG